MITWLDFYNIMSVVVPLYVAMALAYVSVKWWNIFTPDQCAGINRFVAIFACPFLAFHFVSINDPYSMNFRFIGADTLQKVIVLVVLAIWSNLKWTKGNFDWSITLFAISTLPNTLVVGIPMLKAMYGEYTGSLMIQIVVFQSIIWNTLLLFMYEYRGARTLIAERFPENATSIASIHVDPRVISFDERHDLETEVVVKDNGSLHVNVRRSNACQSDASTPSRHSMSILTDFHLTRSLKNPSLRESSSIRRDSMAQGDRSLSYGSNHAMRFQFGSRKVAHIDEETGDGEILNEEEKKANELNSKREGNISEEGKEKGNEEEKNAKAMPSTSVLIGLIFVVAGRKLLRNPNTYANILGIIWSLISFRWNVKMPAILAQSISILSNTGLGMAMFSLGLFMATQPRIMSCTKSILMVSMALKFLAGPAVMAASSAILGIRHRLLHIAVVQAALPLGIVPFVFATEYNVNANVLSTSVSIGMITAVPIGLLYFILLEL